MELCRICAFRDSDLFLCGFFLCMHRKGKKIDCNQIILCTTHLKSFEYVILSCHNSSKRWRVRKIKLRDAEAHAHGQQQVRGRLSVVSSFMNEL